MATNVQEIGIEIDLSSGTFINTVYKDNMLQLVSDGQDADGNSIYAETGEWESEIILIKDKIKAFKNVVKTAHKSGNAYTVIYTQSSEDSFEWTNYVEVGEGYEIFSPAQKYARIKVVFYAEKVNANFFVDDFKNSNKFNNEFTNYDDGKLELKKDYTYKMLKTVEYDEGCVYVKRVQVNDFKKIDKIRVQGVI
ncbi:hypothetical protein EBB07_29630 [Paenibacillaceae bacterium]|nr:hypothetical protein EBB07_29630 [Paenibacillaceae bacterium]